MDHVGFCWELAGKVGAPLFAGTLVACLLSGEPGLLHAALMGSGIALMAVSHWREHHRR